MRLPVSLTSSLVVPETGGGRARLPPRTGPDRGSQGFGTPNGSPLCAPERQMLPVPPPPSPSLMNTAATRGSTPLPPLLPRLLTLEMGPSATAASK